MLHRAVRQKLSREKCPLQRRYCSCLITIRTLTTPKTHSWTIIGRLLVYSSQMHWIRASPTLRSKSLRDKISRIQYSSSNLSKTSGKLSRKWSSRRHWRVTKWKRRRKRTKTNGWPLTIQSSMMKSKLMCLLNSSESQMYKWLTFARRCLFFFLIILILYFDL